MVHYICLASCCAINKPERIRLYYAYEPSGLWWDKAKSLVEVIQVDPPEQIFGNPLVHPAHKSDVLRLEVLLREGGVYLDLDVLCVRPLSSLLDFDAVLGTEYGVGLCNAVILARPAAQFLQIWLDHYRSFSGVQWNHHSVRLPKMLADAHPELVSVLDHRKFFWPTYNREDLLKFLVLEGSTYSSESLCVHLWESMTWKFIGNLSPEDLWACDSEFCRMARQYVDRPSRA